MIPFKFISFIILMFCHGTISEKCRDQYRSVGDLCLKPIPEVRTLDEAIDVCKASKGKLPAGLPESVGRKVIEGILNQASQYVLIGGVFDFRQECYAVRGKECFKPDEIEFWKPSNPMSPERIPCIFLERQSSYRAMSYSCGMEAPAVCTRDANDGCPLGFFQIMHICMGFLDKDERYDKQSSNCQSMQSILAMPRTQSDWQVIGQALILKAGPGPFGFLGGAKKEGTGWVDTKGKAVPDDAWLPGHPDDSIGGCSVMVPHMEKLVLKLQTSPCVTKTGFLCQYDGLLEESPKGNIT